jgi:hypothetical protein
MFLAVNILEGVDIFGSGISNDQVPATPANSPTANPVILADRIAPRRRASHENSRQNSDWRA